MRSLRVRGFSFSIATFSITTFSFAAFGFAALKLAHAEPTAQPLTFRAALDEIVHRSTSVASQQATLEATHARSLPVRLYVYFPTVGVDAKKGREEAYGTGIDGKQLELTAGLNLFKFGGDAAANRAATADESSQAASLDDTLLAAEEAGVEALVGRIERTLEVSGRQPHRFYADAVSVDRPATLRPRVSAASRGREGQRRSRERQFADDRRAACRDSGQGAARRAPRFCRRRGRLALARAFADASAVSTLSAGDLTLSGAPWTGARPKPGPMPKTPVSARPRQPSTRASMRAWPTAPTTAFSGSVTAIRRSRNGRAR